jgi:hypothetical protein
MMEDGYEGTLDLTGSDPDAVGFPAVPSGTYEAHVGRATWKKTDNPDGTKALPDGTPYLALGIRINDDVDEVDGQRVAGVYCGWTNLFVPPADYDAAKRTQMNNRMANFLNAIGEDWQKKNYKMPDTETLEGTPLTVIVRKRYDKVLKKDTNEIEGFKIAGSAADANTPAGLLQ